MPARRRRTMDRNPIRRFQLWDAKMKPDIVAQRLRDTKELARPKMLSYQVTHEYLISLVRDVLSRFPSEAARHQSYMWLAQGIWECSQRFTCQALERCAVQKYLVRRVEGLDDTAMRIIAARLGVRLPPWDKILTEYLNVPVSIGGVTTVWGYPLVKQGTLAPVYIQAEESGLQIQVIVTKPDGTQTSIQAEDLGEGNYKVNILFDQKGMWIIEAVFPDGQRLKKQVYVS